MNISPIMEIHIDSIKCHGRLEWHIFGIPIPNDPVIYFYWNFYWNHGKIIQDVKIGQVLNI